LGCDRDDNVEIRIVIEVPNIECEICVFIIIIGRNGCDRIIPPSRCGTTGTGRTIVHGIVRGLKKIDEWVIVVIIIIKVGTNDNIGIPILVHIGYLHHARIIETGVKGASDPCIARIIVPEP